MCLSLALHCQKQIGIISFRRGKKNRQMAVGEQKLLSHWEVELKMFFVREAGKKGSDLILIGLTGAKKMSNGSG